MCPVATCHLDTCPVAMMMPRIPSVAATVWNHFRYSSPTSSETMHGTVRRGLGRLGGLLDRAADIIAARA